MILDFGLTNAPTFGGFFNPKSKIENQTIGYALYTRRGERNSSSVEASIVLFT